MSASTRTGSVNAALARHIVAVLADRGEPVDFVDLADYDLPMYHGDIEARSGVPATARALFERFSTARRLVIVTPEYNGAFPPLLKNTIDWMSRIDRRLLAEPTIHLAAASPGSLGGVRVLAILRTWMENMRGQVAEVTLSVPKASVGDGGELLSESPVDVDGFLPPID